VLVEDAPTQSVTLLFILAMCMDVMSVWWSWQGATTEGSYCTSQGERCRGSSGSLIRSHKKIRPLTPPHFISCAKTDRERWGCSIHHVLSHYDCHPSNLAKCSPAHNRKKYRTWNDHVHRNILAATAVAAVAATAVTATAVAAAAAAAMVGATPREAETT